MTIYETQAEETSIRVFWRNIFILFFGSPCHGTPVSNIWAVSHLAKCSADVQLAPLKLSDHGPRVHGLSSLQ